MTDSNGTLVSTYAYDPYGNLTSSTGSVANPWRFAGGYFDSSTGLYKYGTRYYNPGFGRWSQQDPVRGHLADPTSLNRYVYAGDDPVNFTDPSGRLSLLETCAYSVLFNILLVIGAGGLLQQAFQALGVARLALWNAATAVAWIGSAAFDALAAAAGTAFLATLWNILIFIGTVGLFIILILTVCSDALHSH